MESLRASNQPPVELTASQQEIYNDLLAIPPMLIALLDDDTLIPLITPLPSANLITKDQLDALIRHLFTLDDAALQTALMSLSMEEALALSAKAQDDVELSAYFTEHANFISPFYTLGR